MLPPSSMFLPHGCHTWVNQEGVAGMAKTLSETLGEAAGKRLGTTPSPIIPSKTPVPIACAFNQMHQLAMNKTPISSISTTTNSLSGHH